MQRLSQGFARSKDPRLGPGSLWAALPIPACRALTYAGHVKSSQLLFAMVLHSNDRSFAVFPSRETLAKYSGVGKGSITAATKVLQEFGFVNIKRIKMGRTYRNEYELLRPCWHWDEFNEVASRYKVPKGHCTGCGHWVYANGWLYDRRPDGLANIRVRIHIGCGGRIKNLTKKQVLNIRKQEESAGMPLYLLS